MQGRGLDPAGDGHIFEGLLHSALFWTYFFHFLLENGRLNQEEPPYRGPTSHTTGFEVISQPPGPKPPSEAYLHVATPDLEHYSEPGQSGAMASQSFPEGPAINTALLSAMEPYNQH